jgi:hypothetical protein
MSSIKSRSPRKSKRSSKKKSKKKSASPKRRSTSRSRKELKVYVEFPGLALYKRTLSPKQYIIRKNGTIKLPKYHILKDVYERAYPPGTFDWKKLADYDVAQERQMKKLRKSLYRENPNDLDTVQLRTIRARLQKFIRAHEAQGLYDYEVAINKPIRNKKNIRQALVKKLKFFYSTKNKKIVDNYLKKK